MIVFTVILIIMHHHPHSQSLIFHHSSLPPSFIKIIHQHHRQQQHAVSDAGDAPGKRERPIQPVRSLESSKKKACFPPESNGRRLPAGICQQATAGRQLPKRNCQ